jgi:hypothetical protein
MAARDGMCPHVDVLNSEVVSSSEVMQVSRDDFCGVKGRATVLVPVVSSAFACYLTSYTEGTERPKPYRKMSNRSCICETERVVLKNKEARFGKLDVLGMVGGDGERCLCRVWGKDEIKLRPCL